MEHVVNYRELKRQGRLPKLREGKESGNERIHVAKQYEKDIASQIKRNPKHLWKYVKSKLKVRHGVANLEREDGALTEFKAEVLNSFFKKVYTLEHRLSQDLDFFSKIGVIDIF